MRTLVWSLALLWISSGAFASGWECEGTKDEKDEWKVNLYNELQKTKSPSFLGVFKDGKRFVLAEEKIDYKALPNDERLQGWNKDGSRYLAEELIQVSRKGEIQSVLLKVNGNPNTETLTYETRRKGQLTITYATTTKEVALDCYYYLKGERQKRVKSAD